MAAINVLPVVTAINDVAPALAAVFSAMLGIYVLIHSFRWIRQVLEIRTDERKAQRYLDDELDQLQADADARRGH